MQQALTLFDNPRPGRKRRRPDDDAPPFTRRVKGGAYQARVWLGRGGSLNLGLFTLSDHPGDAKMSDREHARWAAARAAHEFSARWMGGRTVGDVVAELQSLGFVPAAVVVPEGQRAIPAAAEAGPRETAGERREREGREREERAYGAGLVALAGGPPIELSADGTPPPFCVEFYHWVEGRIEDEHDGSLRTPLAAFSRWVEAMRRWEARECARRQAARSRAAA